MPVMLLVPSDVLHPRGPDDHFAAEAQAAADLGWDVALVDHDAWTRADAAHRATARVPASGGEAVYRGWMVRSEQYAAFAEALARRGVRLRTGPGQYRRAHELPGWYPTLAPLTPRSVWTTGISRAEFHQACTRLGPGPAVLRDYVKSMKHHWQEAAFIPDLADADHAWAVATRFTQLRDGDLVGGFVLRRFEEFTGAEVRLWWADGVCRLVSAHPDTPTEHPPLDLDLAALASLITELEVAFVTVDLARRADDVWRVVELGDGQVSDRPASTTPHALIHACAPAGRDTPLHGSGGGMG